MIVYAANVNTGGALALLHELRRRAVRSGLDLRIRCPALREPHPEQSPKPESGSTTIVEDGSLKDLIWPNKNIRGLYFGNLPPLYRHPNSAVYVHNPYYALPLFELVKKIIGAEISKKYLLLWLYLQIFHRQCDVVLVQTPAMARALRRRLRRPVLEYPFYALPDGAGEAAQNRDADYTFCAIGLPSRHKRYGPLISAIDKLADSEPTLRVAMTIPDGDANRDLLSAIEAVNIRCGRQVIKNFGLLAVEDVWDIYRRSQALVFPSLRESFGLPLIEAAGMGLVVFAPDLPYVGDVIEGAVPIEPLDADNIAIQLRAWCGGELAPAPARIRTPDRGDALLKGDWCADT